MGSLKCKTLTRITLSRPCRRPKRALCRRISANHSCRSYTQAHSVRLILPSPHLSSQQHLSNTLRDALPAGARLAHGARLDALPAQDQRPSLFPFRPVLLCAAPTPHAFRAAAKQRLPQQLKYMGVKSIQLRRMTPRGDRRPPALCSLLSPLHAQRVVDAPTSPPLFQRRLRQHRSPPSAPRTCLAARFAHVTLPPSPVALCSVAPKIFPWRVVNVLDTVDP